MPTKLRMKDTPVEDADKVLKAERKARKRRKREQARRGAVREESMTPPRASTSKLDEMEFDFDESSLPPEQARKREFYEEEDELEDERRNAGRWEDKLRTAAEEDRGVGYYEDLLYSRQPAAGFSFGSAADAAMGGKGKGQKDVDMMDDEEYAEYVRAGIWYRKNKELEEAKEAQRRIMREKEEKERIENEKRDAEERRRIQKLEAMNSKRREAESVEARKRYDDLWKKLVAPPKPPATTTATSKDDGGDSTSSSKQPYPLRFTDFPWPIYPKVPFPPLSWPTTDDITSSAISSFLLAHLEPAARKASVRAAVLAYHPDRFDRLLSRIPEDNEELRERVRELGLRVSQQLNDLLKEM
ncbi:hypothetical protein MNV49_003901 [Pseudohyphozyma bogoriensis]|nr:hypothetical protein MNV49_003901 [Pseudohyphozyma bogoriensis]